MEAASKILGIHHVTAIAGDPQANIDFYTGVLGLRLVKLTVNYDDPHTYHLYYGDRLGHPGSILTFFPWPGAPAGIKGTGQATVTSFTVPPDSMSYWKNRLRENNVRAEEPAKRFGEDCLTFYDRDDLKLELVASEAKAHRFEPWAQSPVPEKNAIRGFYSVGLSEEGYEKTAALLGAMGFRKTQEEGERFRYEASGGGPSTFLDILCQPDLPQGQVLVGTVHHVAFRVAGDEEQKSWRQAMIKAGRSPTPVIDRQYFRSVYFREPGGVLFELATDPPGFTKDESEENLGTSLKLPPWLESSRKPIESALPKVDLA